MPAQARAGIYLYGSLSTSIRRYADLTVHRALKQYLRGRRDFVHADPRETSLVGAARTFTIGMPLQVRVASTDEQNGRIELALVG